MNDKGRPPLDMLGMAANDNEPGGWSTALTQALRLFAHSGLAAPKVALAAAQAAERDRDTMAASRLLAVSRVFGASAVRTRRRVSAQERCAQNQPSDKPATFLVTNVIANRSH